MRRTTTLGVLVACVTVALTGVGGAAHADPVHDFIPAGTLPHPTMSGRDLIVMDASGRLAVADPVDQTITRITTDGTVSSPIPLPVRPDNLLAAPDGAVLAWQASGGLARVDASGAVTTMTLPALTRWVTVAPNGLLQVTDDQGDLWTQDADGSFSRAVAAPERPTPSMSFITSSFDDYVCAGSLYRLTLAGASRIDSGRGPCQGMAEAASGELVVAWSNGDFVRYGADDQPTLIAHVPAERAMKWNFRLLPSGDILYRDDHQSFYRIAPDGRSFEVRRAGWQTSTFGDIETDSHSFAVGTDGTMYSINRRGGIDRYTSVDLETPAFEGYGATPAVRVNSAALTVYPSWSGPTTASFSVVAGALPQGMTLDRTHGDITGTPTKPGTTTAIIRMDPGTGAPPIDRPVTLTISSYRGFGTY